MKKALIIGISFFLPLVAGAQGGIGTIETNIVGPIGKIVGALIPIVFALGLLFFFWGLAQYILASGDPEAQQSGRNKMIWGVVALFVMSAVWGLVRFLRETIGIGSETTVTQPTFVPQRPGL